MKHFIITRFNLKLEAWKTAKDGSLVLTDEWLEERFDLFMNYCYPSVINQTNQNFHWLIFFDIDTPSTYKDKIEDLAYQYKNIKPLFIEGMNVLNTAIKGYIHHSLDSKDDFMITTRLDNDDTIHQEFVNTIQKLAIKKDQTVVDLRRGYQINISNAYVEYRNYSNQFNPFVSLIERTEKFNTVLSRMHKEWRKAESIVVYDDMPLWIEVIHPKNKLNFTRLDIPLVSKVDLKKFGIYFNLKKRNLLYILINNGILLLKKPLRKMRDLMLK